MEKYNKIVFTGDAGLVGQETCQ